MSVPDGIAGGVIEQVRRKGVRLWIENGQLRYKAPKGSLTQEDIESIRKSKHQIVASIEGSRGTEATQGRLGDCSRPDHSPLTHAQLVHWRLHQLDRRPAVRQVASATLVRGRLSLDLLERSVNEVVCRHDALRTRIVIVDGSPVQVVMPSLCFSLKVDDLTTLPEGLREVEADRLIQEHILEPVDVSVGPLFGIKLLRFSDHGHVLVMAMEHSISDAFSMAILLRDLFTFYRQALHGHEPCLPPVALQHQDYAIWQRQSQQAWFERHGAYWSERLAGCPRVRFPPDAGLPTEKNGRWSSIRIEVGKELKSRLSEWCRLRRTTLAMGVFTVYVALVLRWCEVSDLVIQYEINGRNAPELENTIGYFASALSLRIKILKDDDLIGLLSQVTAEYCRAYEHADFSYLEARAANPEFSRNTGFNWIPRQPEINASEPEGMESEITCCPFPFGYPMLTDIKWDNEPMIQLTESEESISGSVYFPADRFRKETIEKFGRNFLAFLGELPRHPTKRLRDLAIT